MVPPRTRGNRDFVLSPELAFFEEESLDFMLLALVKPVQGVRVFFLDTADFTLLEEHVAEVAQHLRVHVGRLPNTFFLHLDGLVQRRDGVGVFVAVGVAVLVEVAVLVGVAVSVAVGCG